MTQAPPGTHDILPSASGLWRTAEAILREVADLFGYEEIRTPLFEETALFVRGVGEGTDIVAKEMYTFEDRGGRSLTLRPEGTAPVARAVLEHALLRERPFLRLFYLGPMYRYERPQKGRYREHWQFGMEALGSGDPLVDAELLAAIRHLLGRFGFAKPLVLLNSIGDRNCRPGYRKALLDFLEPRAGTLCPTCQNRLRGNPLRILDCKEEACQARIADAPSVLEHLCADCAAHFERVRSHLDDIGLPYRIAPRLVRGLDYYTRTTFEVVDDGLGAQSAILGGGRYDDLLETLGGPASPAIGFAMGIERLLLLAGERGLTAPVRAPAAYFVTLGDAARGEALRIAEGLRHAGIAVAVDPLGGSLKSQMRRADREGARYALILGENELARGAVAWKPLRAAGSGQEEVPLGSLEGRLKEAP